MDRCSEHKERQLRDYFLNRLALEEVEAFQFHLFHCETCRTNLERMRLLAHEGEEGKTASDAEKSNVKKRRLTFPTFTRVAAVACIVVALAVGGFYFRMSQPVGDGLQLEMDEAPILHSGDSVGNEADSTVVKLDGKGEGDVVE